MRRKPSPPVTTASSGLAQTSSRLIHATDYDNMLACYRSGQMTEKQWQKHLSEDAT